MLLWLCIAMGLVITQNSEKSRRNSFPGICKTEHLLNIILMSFLSQTIESPFIGRELATENNKQSKVLHWAWNQNSEDRILCSWLFHTVYPPTLIKSHTNWPKISIPNCIKWQHFVAITWGFERGSCGEKINHCII